MNALIETLNRWGEAAIPLAGQMLLQTSLLIIVLLALDLLLRHRIRAGFRYALWMLLLVKLVLPPSLALPTGAGYWIERPVKAEAPVELPVAEVASLPAPAVEVNHAADPGIIVDSGFFELALAEAMADAPPAATTIEFPVEPEPAIQLNRPGQLLTAWLAGTLLLLGWMLWRWRWVTRLVRASEPAPADLQALLANVYRENVCRAACRQFPETARTAEGHERKGDTPVAQSRIEATRVSPFRFFGMAPACPKLRLTDAAMSPAVCGLFRPVILLPRKLVGKLSREQLGTVLLHELIHLRRRDLWVNCVQTLLQIAAWWHPLLWLANARIRRVREEAVDEAVACALRDDADAYPTTLLEVAKLTFTRPLMTLGLVGILESKHALKQRIRRLLELPPLESTRLKWWQWLAVAAIALVAVPMAEGQRATDQANDTSVDVPENAESKPAVPLQLETREFRVNPNTFYQSVERIADSLPPYTNSSGAILKGSQALRSAAEADGVTLVHHFVRDYFEKFGVKLEPPKAVSFDVRKGILMVQATIEDLDIIQRAMEALNTEPPQITLEVRFVEVPIEDRLATVLNWFVEVADFGEVRLIEATTTDNPVTILTGPQSRLVIRVLEQRRGVNFKYVPRVTTLSGHNTELKLRDTPLIVAPKFGPQFDKLEVNPYALVDRENLQMTIIATIRARMVDEQGKGSPHAYSVSQKALATAMKDGQTLLFAVSASLDDSEEKNGNTETLVFITPTLSDPPGNSVNETHTFENQGSLPPQSGTESPLITLSNMLAAARADFEKASSERSTALERLHISDVWMLDKSVLEHSFVRRHLEELNVNPPAEFLDLDKRYQNARILRDSISMKLAQEKVNESLGYHPAPVDHAKVKMVFQQQLDSAERDMELAREEYRALQEKLGPDPLTRPEQTLSEEEFLRLMPVIQASIQLNQSSNSVRSARDRLAEVEARAKGQGSLSPQPAAPTTPKAPDGRVTGEDINALGFDWLRSPPLSLGHTNLTEYGTQMITSKTPFPDPQVSGYRMVGLEPRFVLVPVEGLSKALGGQLPLARPLIIASNELTALTNSLIEAGAVDHSSASPTRFSKMSGGVFHWQVAEGELSQVMFQTADNPATNSAASPRQIVFGARHSVPAFAPDWVPLTLLARPFAGDDDSLHSILSLATGEQQPVVLAQAEETIPPGGSLVWASTNEVRAGFAQAVILHNSGPPVEEADEAAGGAGEAAAKIQSAKELIEAGKLDEAEALLREAAQADPGNSMVSYYFAQINRARQPVEFERAGLREPLTDGQRKLMEKLNRITLDRVEFDNVPLVEAVKDLSDESRRRDPQREGITFKIFSTNASADVGKANITISPPLSNLRMIDVLNAMVMSADQRIKFTVEDSAVVFSARAPEPEHLQTRVFRLDPNTFDRMKAAHTNAPAPGGVVTNEASIVIRVVRDHFEAAGVSLVAPKMIFFNDRTGMLMVKATLEELEIIQGALEKLMQEGEPKTSPPAEAVKEIKPRPEGTAHDAAPADSASTLPRGLLVRGTNPEEIRARLNSTIVPQVEFKDTPLPEVLRTLQGFTRTPGPLPDEIRFIFGLYQDGQPRGRWPDGSLIKPEKIRINVTPPLENRSLGEVLTVVAARSSSPLYFTVESIGVVFRPQMVSERLETRTFRLDPSALYQAMEGVFIESSSASAPRGEPMPAPTGPAPNPGSGGIRFLTVTNDMSVVNPAVREFFEAAGVKLEPPKTLYFNDRTGMLMVRATLADLEIVQNTIEGMSREPVQIQLEVRFIDADEAAVRSMGFDWMVNPAPELEPAVGSTITGVLTDPQARLALSALATRPGVIVSSLPIVTTLSGRQTQIKLSDAASDDAGQPDPVLHQAGSVIDVVPYVSMDGHTIHMAIIPIVTQFLDPVDVENPVNVPSGSDVVISSKPLPLYRLRQIASNLNVWDGQTVVIVYPKIETTRITEDKVPLLGDLPWIGRLFRDENTETETKHTLVFITPTIIDPAGNRVHSAEQMPFTQEQVPRQPGQE